MRILTCALLILVLLPAAHANEINETIDSCVKSAAYEAARMSGSEFEEFIETHIDFDELAKRAYGNKRAWQYLHDADQEKLRKEARGTALSVLAKRLPQLVPPSIKLDFDALKSVGDTYQIVGTAMSTEQERGEIGALISINKDGSCTFHDLMVIGFWLSGFVKEWVIKSGPD